MGVREPAYIKVNIVIIRKTKTIHLLSLSIKFPGWKEVPFTVYGKLARLRIFQKYFSHISDVPHNTYVNLTDGNLTVFILPRSHARVIVVRRHGSVKSVYPLYLH